MDLFTSSAYQLLRQPQMVQILAEEMIQIARDHGYALYQKLGLVQLGWALAAQDLLEAGIARLSQGIDGLRVLKATLFITTPLATLGEALTQSGRVSDGLVAINEGLAISQETEIIHYLPELHRLKGDALLKEKDETGAGASFLKAIEVARSQQTRSWELRATISLARLWQVQGRKWKPLICLILFTIGLLRGSIRRICVMPKYY